MRRYSRSTGTGSYLPPRIVTNAELAQQVETTDEWIVTRTGIRQRHIAEASQTSSDLALEASRAALRAAAVGPGDVDLIVVAEELGRALTPSPFFANLQGSLAVLHGGTDAQRKEILPEVAAGRRVLSFAITEE